MRLLVELYIIEMHGTGVRTRKQIISQRHYILSDKIYIYIYLSGHFIRGSFFYLFTLNVMHTPQSVGLPGEVIGPLQSSLPDNTQHSQQTDIHASGGIRTRNSSKRAGAAPRLRPRGHWDRLSVVTH